MTVVLVTGASRGLGAALAAGLAADGYAVAVNYAHDTRSASDVVDRIRAAGGQAVLAPFDVTDQAAVQAGLAAIRSDLGPVDVIVNNATGPQPPARIEDQSWALYLAQLDFFVKAPLLLLQAALPDWRARKVGRVINIGSEQVDIAAPESAHYVAAKAAMLGLTRSWARELGPEGITVNLVEPGWIPVERHGDLAEGDFDDYRRLVPLGRMGVPDDLVGLVSLLASERASFITGQRFAVNGGRTLG